MSRPNLFLVGCGPGARAHVSPAAEQAVSRAKLLAGAPRLLALFPESTAGRLPYQGELAVWLEQLASSDERPAAVLVSGDPGLCSLASIVLGRFGREHCLVVPGISSVQLACARLGLAWTDAVIIDAHRRVPPTLPAQTAERDPWVLLMGARGAEGWAASLAGGQERRCIVCEDLSLEEEKVYATAPAELERLAPHPRRIVIFSRELVNVPGDF